MIRTLAFASVAVFAIAAGAQAGGHCPKTQTCGCKIPVTPAKECRTIKHWDGCKWTTKKVCKFNWH